MEQWCQVQCDLKTWVPFAQSRRFALLWSSLATLHIIWQSSNLAPYYVLHLLCSQFLPLCYSQSLPNFGSTVCHCKSVSLVGFLGVLLYCLAMWELHRRSGSSQLLGSVSSSKVACIALLLHLPPSWVWSLLWHFSWLWGHTYFHIGGSSPSAFPSSAADASRFNTVSLGQELSLFCSCCHWQKGKKHAHAVQQLWLLHLAIDPVAQLGRCYVKWKECKSGFTRAVVNVLHMARQVLMGKWWNTYIHSRFTC